MIPIIDEIAKIGIIPVIKINDARKAASLAKALNRGGIPCAEVTFRTPEAAKAIKNIADAMDDNFLVGAGTVTTIDQVDIAIESGAKFILTPGFNEAVVRYCLEKNIVIIPGVLSPSEIEKAIECGLDTVKFFPAEQSGGIAMMKALSGPYSGMKYIPTGGISDLNINEYLTLGCVAACGGSFMAEISLIDFERYEEIEQICRRTVNRILDFNLKHVGINSNEAAANDIADFFQKTFGLEKKEGTSSFMMGNQIEVTRKEFPGTSGHIAIGTNNIERAVYYLERKGVAFDYSSIKKDAKGEISSMYLHDEIGGFAVHLVKN